MDREYLDLDEFLSTEEEWHYFAGGLSLGSILGLVLGVLVVIGILWILKQEKDHK